MILFRCVRLSLNLIRLSPFFKAFSKHLVEDTVCACVELSLHHLSMHSSGTKKKKSISHVKSGIQISDLTDDAQNRNLFE